MVVFIVDFLSPKIYLNYEKFDKKIFQDINRNE